MGRWTAIAFVGGATLALGCADGGGGPGGGEDRAGGGDPSGATETNVMSAPCDAATECLPGSDCIQLIDGGPSFCRSPDGGVPHQP